MPALPPAVVTLLSFVVLAAVLWLVLTRTVLGRGLSVPLRVLARRPVTIQYPEVKREPEERFHGRHQLNFYPDGLEKCIGCELCAWACPADAIYVQGADNTAEARYSPGERYAEDYQINYNRCIFCGLCIEACPTRALTMTHEYELSFDRRADLIFTKDRLLAPLPEGATPPPHPDEEVRARGRNYYGGQAATSPTLAGGRYTQAAPAPSARARSVLESGRLPGPGDQPYDAATVGAPEGGEPREDPAPATPEGAETRTDPAPAAPEGTEPHAGRERPGAGGDERGARDPGEG